MEEEGLGTGGSRPPRAKKDRRKHVLIAHNLQSLPQRPVRRNKDQNRHNSDLKRLINTIPAISTHFLTRSH